MTAEFDATTTALILERDRGRCVRCGKHVLNGTRGFDWSIHHRQGRGKAAHLRYASNGVILCGTGVDGCHGHVERNRSEAYDTGLLVRRLGIEKPSQIAVQHPVHGFVRLLDDGTTTPG